MKARKKCEICSELTMKTLERRRSGVFIINFEHIIQLLLSLFVDSEQLNIGSEENPKFVSSGLIPNCFTH